MRGPYDKDYGILGVYIGFLQSCYVGKARVRSSGLGLGRAGSKLSGLGLRGGFKDEVTYYRVEGLEVWRFRIFRTSHNIIRNESHTQAHTHTRPAPLEIDGTHFFVSGCKGCLSQDKMSQF